MPLRMFSLQKGKRFFQVAPSSSWVLFLRRESKFPNPNFAPIHFGIQVYNANSPGHVLRVFYIILKKLPACIDILKLITLVRRPT